MAPHSTLTINRCSHELLDQDCSIPFVTRLACILLKNCLQLAFDWLEGANEEQKIEMGRAVHTYCKHQTNDEDSRGAKNGQQLSVHEDANLREERICKHGLWVLLCNHGCHCLKVEVLSVLQSMCLSLKKHSEHSQL